MFANLFQLISRHRPPIAGPGAFVEDVVVHHREKRNPKTERLILWCWVLIAVKHVLIILAVWKYHIPFHQLWVNFPTWLAGVLATGVYYWNTRKR